MAVYACTTYMQGVQRIQKNTPIPTCVSIAPGTLFDLAHIYIFLAYSSVSMQQYAMTIVSYYEMMLPAVVDSNLYCILSVSHTMSSIDLEVHIHCSCGF